MLCLNRRNNQRVRILLPTNEEIWVTYERIGNGNQCKLHFDAPFNVQILREELLPVEEQYQTE